MKKPEKPDLLTPAVFFLFIALCAVSLLFSYGKTYSEKEKRYLAEFPDLSAAAVLDGTAQTEFETWLADHFPFRDFWVGTNAYLQLAEGRNAQQDIYHADDGYLINAPKTLDTDRFTENLTRFDNFAADRNLPASVIIVPSPGAINEDLLPRGHGDYHEEELFTLARDTLRTATLWDFRDALRAANGRRPVYYHTDHHLTAYGCYTLYTNWRVGQGHPYTPEAEFTVTSYGGFYGTTWSGSGYWLIPPDEIEIWDSGADVQVTISDGANVATYDSLYFMDRLEELDKYPVYLDGNHPLVTIQNPDASGGTLLVVKDSYAHCFTTFLANDYREIDMVDLRYYRGSLSGLVEECEIDEILYFYGIDNLLTDTNSVWLY